MEESSSLKLLRKFIKDECSVSELEAVKKLINEGIDESLWQQLLLEEQTTIEAFTPSLNKEYADSLYRKIKDRIQSSPKPAGKQRQLSFLKWASSIAAALLIGMFIFYQISVNNTSVTGNELMRVATQSKERKHLQMADSSSVWINGKSSLRFPEIFSTSKREVFLEGEGFFSIKKDSKKPFIVHTGGIAVKVLGTSFNVKSFTDDNETTITLATGKIAVESAENEVIELVPGEQLAYSKKQKTFRKTMVDANDSYAWRKGVLLFKSTPLAEIVVSLERWYGVHISITDEQLGHTLITLKQKEGSLQEVLDVLAFSAKLDYVVRGDSVILTKTN